MAIVANKAGTDASNIPFDASFDSPTKVSLNVAPLIVGDNVLVAAAVGRSVRLARISFDVAGAANLQFFDGPSANAKPLSGVITLGINGAFQLPRDGDRRANPWMKTSPGNALVMVSSAAVNIGGLMEFFQNL